MATNFPAGSDVFNVPSSPGSTALSAAGTGSKNHVQHHRDLGDAIEAMQAEATLAVHSHNGSTARHGSKLSQANTHESPDTDSSSSAIHHTLGHGANQAAPGNHASLPAFSDTHTNSVAWPVGSVYITTSASNPNTLLGVGTWTQIAGAFLVGVGGSYSYTGSVVNNTSTHSHSVPDTAGGGDHTHASSATASAVDSHKHSGGTSGTSSVWHTHGGSGGGNVTSYYGTSASDTVGSTKATLSYSHSHSLGNGPSSSNHNHTINDYYADGGHGHTLSGVNGPQHGHSITTDSPSHLPPWKAFNVWRRTA